MSFTLKYILVRICVPFFISKISRNGSCAILVFYFKFDIGN